MWLNFAKVVTFLCFAFYSEHILCEMVNSILLLVAWIEEYFEVLLSTLNCVSVHTSSLINTSNSVLNTVVNATLSLETRYAAQQLLTSFTISQYGRQTQRFTKPDYRMSLLVDYMFQSIT